MYVGHLLNTVVHLPTPCRVLSCMFHIHDDLIIATVILILLQLYVDHLSHTVASSKTAQEMLC